MKSSDNPRCDARASNTIPHFGHFTSVKLPRDAVSWCSASTPAKQDDPGNLSDPQWNFKMGAGVSMATSARTRTTITTRIDSPAPRRRKRKKELSVGAVVLIVLALFIFFKIANQNHGLVRVQPVAQRGR